MPESFWEESPQHSEPASLPALVLRLVKNGSGSNRRAGFRRQGRNAALLVSHVAAASYCLIPLMQGLTEASAWP